jgi:general secretion pathway protein G
MGEVRKQAGFTLIEILVVVFIIALLASLVTTNLFNRADDAKKKTAKAQIEGFEQAVRVFQLDTGRLPTAAEGLRVLVPPPPVGVQNYHPDGYLDDIVVPLDPWDNEYDYRPEGTRFTVISYGSDGVPSNDDITNWTVRH